MLLESPIQRTEAQQEAAVSYEAARRQLARALAEWSDELAQGELDTDAAHELARRRSDVIEQGLRFFGPLRRFVRHEVELWADPTLLEYGQISVDDVVASIYLAAVDAADHAPTARAFYTWLRRIARREVRTAVIEHEVTQRRERSLETPVAVVGEWPDHVIRLISVLSDPNATLPEDVLTKVESRPIVQAVMARLPERWREVSLLRVIDSWEIDDIAEAEGITSSEVLAIVEATRTFLHDWLHDDPHFAAA